MLLTAGIPTHVPCFDRAVNKISQQKWDKDASTVAFYSSCKYCASELLRVQVRKMDATIYPWMMLRQIVKLPALNILKKEILRP